MTIKDVTNKMRHKAIPHNFYIISWWMLPIELQAHERRDEMQWHQMETYCKHQQQQTKNQNKTKTQSASKSEVKHSVYVYVY